MATILDIQKKYRGKIDYLDLELIIAHALRKSREFVLSHPEFTIAKNQESKIINNAKRRIKCEPLAYILGEKEFYGLKFKVDKSTLIPRPETEMMVDLVSHNIKHKTYSKKEKIIIADIGTGSGNIIISLAHSIKHETCNKFNFFGVDISRKALAMAKYNAKENKSDKKIKFLHGNLLSPFIENCKLKIENYTMTIVANLPYLSPKIYASCSKDIKKYEPKSALISQEEGLAHYNKLLEQILVLKQDCSILHVSCFMEISPEQKNKINKLAKKYFPEAKTNFHKDLSGRWRICELAIFNSQ